jgi:TonB family protein
MYLDLEDHRPDTPRVPAVISRREGVLLSLVVHLLALVFILLAPTEWFEASADEREMPQPAEPVRFVEMLPAIDRAELARRLAEQSDMDRRSATIERAPVPENEAPLSRGNTPEKIVGAPELPEPEPPPAGPTPAEPAPPRDNTDGLYTEAPPPAKAATPAPALGRALRNLERYVQEQSFHNVTGGNTNQSADIQFDSKGVDFGPWLRRFVAQIRRNWLIPQVAELARGRVVVQFTVLRNGTIVDLRVSQPAAINALTISALNALKLSNPTAALPPEFPDDFAPFTVTFHYNEPLRDGP